MAKRAKLTLTDAEEPKKTKARKATVKKAPARKSAPQKTTAKKTTAKKTVTKAATAKKTAKKDAPKKTATKRTTSKPASAAKVKPDHGASTPQPHQNRGRNRAGSPPLSKQAALGLGVLAVLAAGIFLFAKSRA